MKKLLLSLVVSAFAVVAVQAGDGACSEGGSCCAAKKTVTEAKGKQCPLAGKQAKNQKNTKQQASAKQVKSPKSAS